MGAVSRWMALKTMELQEIAQGESVERRGSQTELIGPADAKVWELRRRQQK